MKKYTQRIFNGHIVDIDKVDMKDGATCDCENINISKRGELNNMRGMVKINTSELESGVQVDGINHLDSDEYAICNGKVLKL